MQIGPYQLRNNLVLAPMAGVTDRPFRRLCREMGASLAVSEMMAANPELRNSRKSKLRMNHLGEQLPISVQIAGGDPLMLAEAARFNVNHGAQIIDINMGCPVKKVCKKAAGSALLKDEKLVADILTAVVNAVDVPVTLKIRTGWSPEQRNGVTIARLAEDSGIQALAVHGRTRACRFAGTAEYDTIAEIKQTISIPVIANGDIQTPMQAKSILRYTGADGLMIGRAAQGKPWIFGQIDHYLRTGKLNAEPDYFEVSRIVIRHVTELHDFYGPAQGLRIARKHLSWYLDGNGIDKEFKHRFYKIEDASEQLDALQALFERLIQKGEEIAA